MKNIIFRLFAPFSCHGFSGIMNYEQVSAFRDAGKGDKPYKTDMKQKLRILNLEDNEDDFEVIRATLRRQGVPCDLVRVDTREAFVGALETGGFDLVLADYSLPTFDGFSALQIVKDKFSGLPFIFVSGVIGEEFAVETLKRGATDYLIKDNLSRLASAIKRALIERDEQAGRIWAERELEKYRKQLEELVRDRTTELNRTNEMLQRELAERRRAQEELYRREREVKALVENAPDMVQRFDRELRHLYINPAVRRLTGMPPQSFVGRTYGELGFPEELVTAWDKALRGIFETGVESVIEFEMPTRSGSRCMEARLVPEFSKDGSIESVLAVSRDITDRKDLEEKLNTAAITDELTELFNRRGFLIFAQRQCEVAKRYGRHFSILFLDLDGMKKINDNFGHKEGDRALTDISAVLRRTFRESDIIARIGGDEFTVLITEPSGPDIEKTVEQHIGENLKIYNERPDRGYRLSVSMGMVHYDPEHPRSLEELLHRADELMYEHKQKRQHKEEMPVVRKGIAQKRTHDRRELLNHFAADLSVSGVSMIKNISLGGISVKTSQRVAKDTVYRIRIRNDRNEELSLKGVVVWSSLVGAAPEKGEGSYYETGLSFVELNEGLKSSLEKFILGLGG